MYFKKWECCHIWKQPFGRNLKKELRLTKKWWLKIWKKNGGKKKGDEDVENKDWANEICIFFFREPTENQPEHSVWEKQTFFIIRLIFHYEYKYDIEVYKKEEKVEDEASKGDDQ